MSGKTDKAAILQLIRDKIQFLDMKPGDRLNEKALAEELGISRTPIREALIILSDENLIDIYPQSGTFVSKINVTLVKELVYLRHVLEVDVLDGLCNKKAKVEPLVEKCMVMQELAARNGDVVEYIRYDDEFHNQLFTAAGYPKIWQIIASTRSHHTRFRVLDLSLPTSLPDSYNEHRQIIEAIENGRCEELNHILGIHHDTELMNKDVIVRQHPEYFE